MSSFGAPQKRGAFPLDHDGECKALVQKYLKCLKESKASNMSCRELSKAYLECRMQRGLMAKDEMQNLGFHDKTK
ncbi:hypothetical protein BCR44DRAFT_1442911 [Catenaria anguillulae PL171]|uniref:CHCH domain-containing protein n=1 Tax=Catenaria anguillulae PL171 TaxID=765915 RepID=A0A1Y2H9C9_9FUNG|nr:hypothetical protein BCR44DRAFT_1442911 [Catenaria anguillulae PL171]